MHDWKIIYSHGRNGHPWNDPRIEAIKEIANNRHIAMDSIPYHEHDTVEQMIDQAFTFCTHNCPPPDKLILIGSSRGAYIISALTALLYAGTNLETAGLFLMAPAINIKPDYYPAPFSTPIATNTEIVHPYADEVVPVANTFNFCLNNKLILHLVEDTHELHNQVEFIARMVEQFIGKCLK